MTTTMTASRKRAHHDEDSGKQGVHEHQPQPRRGLTRTGTTSEATGPPLATPTPPITPGTRHQPHSTGVDEPTRKHEQRRYTWQGHIFGQLTKRMIDYVGSDRRTAGRARGGGLRRHLGFPMDHFAVGQTYDLRGTHWNAGERATRQPPKPIGWQLRDDKTQSWVDLLSNELEKWNPNWTTKQLTDLLSSAVPYGCTRAQRRSVPTRTSTTENDLRDRLHKAATQDERTKIRRRLWEERRRIQN